MASETLTSGLLLKHLRLNKGLTTEELARIAEVSRSSIYDMENDVYGRPRVKTAKAIADVFGVQVTDLWPVLPPETQVAD